MAMTPSALATLDPFDCPHLKVVQVAGEAPTKELATKWARVLDVFFIGLGPTECSGHVCCGKFTIGNEVNIGFPVNNAAVYIVNESGEIQPAGVVGELCIAGSNISGGYLNRDDLNSKHFIKNPFNESLPNMYKTGDLARRINDGKIEFVGRHDNQIQIRGFRVEIKEIIQAILKYEKVTGAEVVFHSIDGKEYLSAYITPILDHFQIEEIRKSLTQLLPSYMIPNTISSLDSFPLNKNGKCDKQSLPKPMFEISLNNNDHEEFHGDGIDLTDEVSKTIVDIWVDELNISEEELCSSKKSASFFFLGGTSLTAVTTVARVNKALSTTLKVSDLVAHDSLSIFIDYVSAQRKSDFLAQESPVNISHMLKFHGGNDPIRHLGQDLSPLSFAIVHAVATLCVIVGLLCPVGIGILIFYYLLEVVRFPAVLLLLPLVYTSVAIMNLLMTRMVIDVSGVNNNKTDSFAYPVKSLYFIRWWMVQKMVANTCNLFWFANGSRVIVWVFKVLGAKVGKSSVLDNVMMDIPSMISIGKESSIGYRTRLSAGEVRGDYLVIAPITIGNRIKTEPRAIFTPGSSLPDGCVVLPFSCITPALKNCQQNLILHGSPAVPTGEESLKEGHVPLIMHSIPFCAMQMVSMYLLALLAFVGIGISTTIGLLPFSSFGTDIQIVYFVTCCLPIAFTITLIVVILVKRVTLNNPETLVVHSNPTQLFRVWFVDTVLLSPMLNLALEYLIPPSMYHWLLRAMGGKAGSNTFWNAPLMRAGMEHIMIGKTLHSGFQQVWSTQTMTSEGIAFKPIKIGNHCTIGQRSVIMPGVLFYDDVCVTSEGPIISDMEVESGGTVMGNPPTVFYTTASHDHSVHLFQDSIHNSIHKRKKEDMAFADTEIHPIGEGDNVEGSVLAFNIIAVIINVLKLPTMVAVFIGSHFLFSWAFGVDNLNVGTRIVVSLASYVCGASFLAVFVSFLTRVGATSMKIGYSTSYYTIRFISWWYSRWLNRFVSGIILYPFQGTTLYNLWLKLVGAKIGKGCFIDPGLGGFLEIDNMHIGSESIILTPNVHGHFVDHNKLQFAPVVIGQQCRANIGSTIMPFTTIEDRITILSQCTTTKGQILDKKEGFYMGNTAFQLQTSDLNIEI